MQYSVTSPQTPGSDSPSLPEVISQPEVTSQLEVTPQTPGSDLATGSDSQTPRSARATGSQEMCSIAQWNNWALYLCWMLYAHACGTSLWQFATTHAHKVTAASGIVL